jgi:Uma2 family endonuclease
MAVPIQHPRLSSAEFAAMQFDVGWSFAAELIDGEPVVIPPDHPPAASAQGALFVLLHAWNALREPRGLLLPDVFVRVDATSTLGPDIAWWGPERRPPVKQELLTVIPDWVAEVLSPSTRLNDLGPKRERYLAAGVRELWFVDPAARSVTVVDAAGRERVCGERCESLVLDSFSVETTALFAD